VEKKRLGTLFEDSPGEEITENFLRSREDHFMRRPQVLSPSLQN
jgi:hypothetical protein